MLLPGGAMAKEPDWSLGAYGGKYYDKDTLELVAWTSKGEFTLL
jgi:hypothetical protein